MIYDVRHRTTFTYEQSVSVSQHVLHLRLRGTAHQAELDYRLDITPAPSAHTAGYDFFGNDVEYLSFHEPHTELVIEANSVVEVAAPQIPDHEQTTPWEAIAERLRRGEPDVLDPLLYCFDSPYIAADEQVREYALPSFTAGRPIVAAVFDLTARIFDEFEYQGGVSDVSTPVAQVLQMRKGVCQDFAHLQIAALRSLGLPARYVSGYLLTRPPEGQERLVGSDASHAWVSVWCGDAGWIDFDPTNRIIPTNEHITAGWGRDYGDVSPINGFIVGGGAHTINVAVDVVPRAESA